MNDDFTHEFFGNHGVRIAIIGVLAILALFLFAETVTLAKNFGRSGVPATDTITVTGSGQATLPPDIATITFGVQNTAPTVSDAQTATTKQANAALDFVKGKGVADKDVRTLSYNISPHYTYPQPCFAGEVCPFHEPKITGYDVSETIEVKIHDLSMVGDVLQGLGSLQVQNVNGPSFALDDENAGYDAARADAINNAKTQASLLAKQLGVSLGKIVNFSESSGNMPEPMYGLGMGAAEKSAPAPTVPTGENTYNASVSITYEIR